MAGRERTGWRVPGGIVAGLVLLAAGSLPAALAGRVEVSAPGEDGPRPLAGAVVSLWREAEGDATCLGHWRTTEEGTVDVPDGPLARATLLVATAPGFARRDVPLGAERERIAVRLEPGFSRPLAVLDFRGRPVPRFRWAALPLARFEDDLQQAVMRGFFASRIGGAGLDRQPAGRLALEAEGTRAQEEQPGKKRPAVMRGLEEGEHLLLVGVPGYGVQAVRFDPAAEGPVVVRLPDPATCRPLPVLDRGTGQPLAGVVAAPFAAFAEGSWEKAWPAVPTGPDGLLPTACPASIRWLGPATGVLVAPDHAPFLPREWAGRGGNARDRWEMDEGVVIEGTATGQDGEPLAGCRVAAGIEGIVREAEVDATGAFRLAGVPRGTVHLELVGKDGATLLARELDTRERDRFRLEFGLGRGLVFRLLREGEPWTGTRVALVQPGEGDSFRVLAVAEPREDGLVRLPVAFGTEADDDDEPARLQIVILDRDSVVNVPLPGRGLLGWIRSFFTGEEKPRTVDVAGRLIEGKVVDADSGEAIEGAFVNAYRYGHCLPTTVDRDSPLYVAALGGHFRACEGTFAWTAADEDGSFRLFVPAGDRTLTAEGPADWREEDGAPWSGESRPLSEIPPGEPVVFRLRRSARVHVRVVTADGQLPPGCAVGWHHVAEGPAAAGHVSPCREGGNDLYPPPGVPVLFSVQAPGYARGIEGPLTLSPDRRETIELTLTKGGSIRLEMDAPPTIGGRPWLPPGVLRDAAGRDLLPLVKVRGTPDLHTVVFSDLAPGNYVVEILGERRRVRVEEGEEVTVRIGDPR